MARYSKNLEQKVEELEVAVQDYRRIRNALGAGIVDNFIEKY